MIDLRCVCGATGICGWLPGGGRGASQSGGL